MSQHMELDAEDVNNCLNEHFTAIEEMVKKTPDRASQIVQEFMARCANRLGLAKPSSKKLLFRLFRSVGSWL